MIRTGAAFLTAVLVASEARADEPPVRGEPPMMREPANPFMVADAFDEDDPFDVEIALGFQLELAVATIGQEHGDDIENVARYTRLTARLLPRVEIGLYHDLAATLSFPVVLSDSRDLEPENDATSGSISADGEKLVALPMNAVERSGLDHIGAGLRWTPLNQSRDRRFPTWLLAVEGRFAVGPVMRACNDHPPTFEVKCAAPGDADRDGRRDEGEPELGEKTGAGLARGTAAVAFKTAVSRRVRYVEPYGMLDGVVEIPLPGSLFDEAALGETILPPVRGALSAGVVAIPWENREKFSRINVDMRAVAIVRSSGLDYSEVFDAIGSSDAPSLRAPEPGRITTGLTTVAAHAAFAAGANMVWQASAFIKLALGAALRYELPHALTADDETSPAFRSSISPEGRRLVVRDSFVADFNARGEVTF
ncbi:MAG: hypothetical protein HOV80_01885 [Polyangiaceae bacterium]|nr:hypothetical protein [Polyangiaceae bacterium]